MLQRRTVSMLGYSEIAEVDEIKERIAYSYHRCKRLYIEFLMVVYNDIMPAEDYKHALNLWLKTKSKFYKLKLERHYESINWLMNQSIGSLCFEVLELNHLTKSDIINSILKKFNSPMKFNKFYICFAKEETFHE